MPKSSIFNRFSKTFTIAVSLLATYINYGFANETMAPGNISHTQKDTRQAPQASVNCQNKDSSKAVLENEIVENVHGSHMQVEDSISRLWNSAVICKDSDSKYRFVIEKFSIEEAAGWIIRKILSVYGFINYEIYSQISGSCNEYYYKKFMDEYLKKNILKEVFLPDTKKFFLVKEEFLENAKNVKREVLLSPRDLLYSMIKQLIKKNFGGTRKFIYAINGKVKMEIVVKRNRNDLLADSIEGEMEYLQDVKKIMAASGFSIRERSP